MQVEINDYYPENKDGIHKFVWAMYIQRYNDQYDIPSSVISALTHSVSNALEKLWETIGYKNYTKKQPLLYVAPPNAGWDDFQDFFYKLDQITDSDDRILLFIVGHGGVNLSGIYNYKLGYGEVPDAVLYKLFKILGPALDFIWMLTCYSADINFDYLQSLNNSAQSYIIWVHKGNLYFGPETEAINQFAKDINNAINFYEEHHSIISTSDCSLYLAGIFSDINEIDNSWCCHDFHPTSESDLITSLWPSFIGGSYGTMIGVIYLPFGFIQPY